MKKQLFLSILLATLSTLTQATTVHVSAKANQVLATNGTFGSFTTGTQAFNNRVTRDVGTYVGSNDAVASIDLGFDSTSVYSGNGADLVIFTVGNGYNFGLQVFDTNNNQILGSNGFNFSVPADGSSTATDGIPTEQYPNGTPLCLTNGSNSCIAAISATAVNLTNDTGNSIANNIEIGKIRVFIGSNYNGQDANGNTATPLFSLAGALHITTVPLPLPIILFSSGLALLGWAGRKKTA